MLAAASLNVNVTPVEFVVEESPASEMKTRLFPLGPTSTAAKSCCLSIEMLFRRTCTFEMVPAIPATAIFDG